MKKVGILMGSASDLPVVKKGIDMLTLVAIVVLVCLLVVPQLGSCFRLVFAELPAAMLPQGSRV